MGNANACQQAALDGLDSMFTSEQLATTISNVEPWCAKDLISGAANRQNDLARRSPFRFIHVRDGLSHFARCSAHCSGRLSREDFADAGEELLKSRQAHGSRQDVYEVFSALDLNDSGVLSHGEWVAGMANMFKGNNPDRAQAVFDGLQLGRGGLVLTKAMVIEYLCPIVKAMVPEGAAAFRSILLSKVVDDVFADMDAGAGSLTLTELVQWVCKSGTPIWLDSHQIFIDHLAGLVNDAFFEVWRTCHSWKKRTESGNWRQRGDSACAEDLMSALVTGACRWTESRRVVAL